MKKKFLVFLAQVWARVKSEYKSHNFTELDGPELEEVLGRTALKWYTTVETDSDLVSIDFYVLERKEEGIPGVTENKWRGETHYYAVGLGGRGGEISAYEAEQRRPGFPIRVVLEIMGMVIQLNQVLSPIKTHLMVLRLCMQVYVKD